MNRQTQNGQAGKTRKAVPRALLAVVILLVGVLVWSGFTEIYRYHSVNGYVWLSQQSLLERWLGFKPQVFHCVRDGEIQVGQQGPLANSLVMLPPFSSEIPRGKDPYLWKPQAEAVKARLNEKYYSYESITFMAALAGADTNLLAGETRTIAHERLLEFAAQKYYCSFGDQLQH